MSNLKRTLAFLGEQSSLRSIRILKRHKASKSQTRCTGIISEANSITGMFLTGHDKFFVVNQAFLDNMTFILSFLSDVTRIIRTTPEIGGILSNLMMKAIWGWVMRGNMHSCSTHL
jgi:hypothetical protein